MKKLIQATIDHLQKKGISNAKTNRNGTLVVDGHQVKFEELEDLRGASRKVRVNVFDAGIAGRILGSKVSDKTGKAVAETIIKILNGTTMRENKLREVIREMLQEVSIDRGFLNSFAEALEDLTGRETYVKTSEDNTIRYDGKGSRIDIHLRSAAGNRLGGDVEVKVVDARGTVRTGIDVPPDPEVAAEETARELDKINENLRSKIRNIIREETEDEEEMIQGEERDEEEDAEERVGVENAESGNYYNVRRSYALANPQKYKKIRETVRKTVKKMLSENQIDMFGGATRLPNPSEMIQKATSFEVHDKEPMDFGKHFESRDIAEIVDFLQRSGNPEEYEVAMFEGRSPLSTIPARQFLRLVQDANLTAKP